MGTKVSSFFTIHDALKHTSEYSWRYLAPIKQARLHRSHIASHRVETALGVSKLFLKAGCGTFLEDLAAMDPAGILLLRFRLKMQVAQRSVHAVQS